MPGRRWAPSRSAFLESKGPTIEVRTVPYDLIDVAAPFTVNGKRDRYLRGPEHSVEMSFAEPVGFLYKNRKSGLVITISLESYADFQDEGKVANALETLYLRAIYYNEQAGYKSESWWKKTFWPYISRTP